MRDLQRCFLSLASAKGFGWDEGEVVDAMLSGDVDTGKTILRHCIKASVGGQHS